MFGKPSKRELKEELREAKADMLYYKAKYLLIEQKLREQKDRDSNVFTLLRDIKAIVYCDVLPKELKDGDVIK